MRIGQPISRLQAVSLRKLWPHEALGFTTWIAENLEFLSETLGFGLAFGAFGVSYDPEQDDYYG